MKQFTGFMHGMGIGGWLTNYKRFNVLPNEWRQCFTIGDYEHFASYIGESDVRFIASLGMDHIRLGFDQIVLEEKPGVYRKEIMEHIDRFVGWCHKYGLNVVLNLHKAVGNYCDIKEEVSLFESDDLKNRFIMLWQYLEDHFVNDPSIAFELLNEVRDEPPELWNDLADRTIAAIRKKDLTRTIIVGSTCWNSVNKLNDLKIWDDDNVIYTFHFYDPFEFTHQRGVLQAPCCYYNREMPYPGDIERYRDFQQTVNHVQEPYKEYEIMDSKYIEDALSPALSFMENHPDKVLWCGEFGTIRHCKTVWRENWMNDVIHFLIKNEIPYCVWNYLSTPNDGNKFSLVDDENRQIVSERMEEIICGDVSL